MIPYSRPTLAEFYTLFHTKLLKTILHSGTYPYSLDMIAPFPPSDQKIIDWSWLRRELISI